MELISKQSKDIMGQELLIKMTVADLVILESILDHQKDDDIFTALHVVTATQCKVLREVPKEEWETYETKRKHCPF